MVCWLSNTVEFGDVIISVMSPQVSQILIESILLYRTAFLASAIADTS